MDLSTDYLGFHLPHPLICGAGPLLDELDTVRRLEDAGAAALVMRSLFEEQLDVERRATFESLEQGAESFGEATSYLPEPTFRMGPEEYLEQIRRIKEAVSIPVMASLNGVTPGGWLDHATEIEGAGADALELNLYDVAANPEERGTALEERSLEIIRTVRAAVRIPVAVKLSPFYSSLAHFAHQLDGLGIDGIVLFNRFYQPDIDVEELEVVRTLSLSSPMELLLRLRWLAILSGRVAAHLAVTGGVHGPLDAVKAVMTGAHAVQMVSALLRHGPGHFQTMLSGIRQWLEEHEYESLRQMQGSMSLRRCPDPEAYERANYVQILQTWRPEPAESR
ncbi:MAG: dihydroorotate dehydrogenase-like protein [Acidobacteriota bacterium]|jgi:dihydroorotate dehydrogenase (fumarate)